MFHMCFAGILRVAGGSLAEGVREGTIVEFSALAYMSCMFRCWFSEARPHRRQLEGKRAYHIESLACLSQTF